MVSTNKKREEEDINRSEPLQQKQPPTIKITKLTVVLWILIQSVEAIVVFGPVLPSPTGISQSFANEGPNMRTPSRIRRPAAAAEAAADTVKPVASPLAPELWPIPPSLRNTVSIISRTLSTTAATACRVRPGLGTKPSASTAACPSR